ncbi:MAG: TldD/PmbA family protein [Oligoflexales bacterium]|nr:TldD/PmbA family protein [Oligoflexales bacterium]
MKKLLKELVRKSGGFVELRYHKRISNSFIAQRGRVDVADHSEESGVGVRALVEGVWGFAATSDLEVSSIEGAVRDAQRNAKVLSRVRSKESSEIRLASSELSREDHVAEGTSEILNMSISEKLSEVIGYEKKLRKASSVIHTAKCHYCELVEEKIIVTSDGAEASLKIAQPEITLTAIAEKGGEQVSARKTAGVVGGWNCLLAHPSLVNMVDEVAQVAVDLIKAKYPRKGKRRVILSPSVVGLLCHEAIGHTVEADFVKSGSVARDKIGVKVASDLVSIYDTGMDDGVGYAAGRIPFDDEGVKTRTAKIIDRGILTSYLHNRESSFEFQIHPTGNARAWLYNDEPLIRMRNTYMLPGTSKLEDMISELDDGYLIEGGGGGQADSNGEFMFGCSHIWEIKNGKKGRLFRSATLSGIAFDVLSSVDSVSREFLWDLGSGYCGKGQPAKVDAGGPYIRCLIHVGGHK